MSQSPLTLARAGCRLGQRPERRDRSTYAGDGWLETHLQGFLLAHRPGASSWGAFIPTLSRIHEELRKLRDMDELGRLRDRRELASLLDRSALQRDYATRTFAHVSFECRRLYDLDLHDEQLYAGWSLLDGQLIEMQTGEGKTLAAALAAITVALTGTPVHIVTANDYLAARDHTNLKPLYRRFRLTSAHLDPEQGTTGRRAVYGCDIVHCSNQQLVFDYLRDQRRIGAFSSSLEQRLSPLLVEEREAPVMRGLCFAIVDEADSVLLDDARLPLVLSEPVPGDTRVRADISVALAIARSLHEGVDFRLEHAEQRVQISPQGRQAIADQCTRLRGIWRFERFRIERIRQALTALHLFKLDQDYVVKERAVVLIDRNTSRPASDRRLSNGLHQMLEIKEHCRLTEQNATLESISFQNFFRRYHLLSGMSGTLSGARTELRTIYRLPVRVVPTHRRSRRQVLPSHIWPDRDTQHRHILDRVRLLLSDGRPVLIGTRSVAQSEELGKVLCQAGFHPRVLNARRDDEEADIIEAAGQPGALTVATHMAGRGSDIPLHPSAETAGGLHVLNVAFNDSPRVDRQLLGRSARQGAAGSAESIYSLDDPLLAQSVSDRVRHMLVRLSTVDNRSTHWLLSRYVWQLQKRLDRRHFHQRLNLFLQRSQLRRRLDIAGN